MLQKSALPPLSGGARRDPAHRTPGKKHQEPPEKQADRYPEEIKFCWFQRKVWAAKRPAVQGGPAREVPGDLFKDYLAAKQLWLCKHAGGKEISTDTLPSGTFSSKMLKEREGEEGGGE